MEVVHIIGDDEDHTEMTEEEKAKRKEFERKRKKVATPEGLDIKAVLGHRVPISNAEDDEDDVNDEKEAKGGGESFQKNEIKHLHSNPWYKKPQNPQK